MKHGAIGQTVSDSAYATPVTATADEIRFARELRRQLVQRYLNAREHASRPAAAWCVGAD